MNGRRGSSGRADRYCAGSEFQPDSLGAVRISGETVFFNTWDRPIRADDRVVACIRIGTGERPVLCVGDALADEGRAGETTGIRRVGSVTVEHGTILGRLVDPVQFKK